MRIRTVLWTTPLATVAAFPLAVPAGGAGVAVLGALAARRRAARR